jgi:hypothetical protein
MVLAGAQGQQRLAHWLALLQQQAQGSSGQSLQVSMALMKTPPQQREAEAGPLVPPKLLVRPALPRQVLLAATGQAHRAQSRGPEQLLPTPLAHCTTSLPRTRHCSGRY